jgi:DNA-binding beta-propeller fold protein YncE
MRDLDERFRALREASAPDLWPDIQRRAPMARGPRAATRWIAAAAAFALAGAGLFLVARAFRTDRPPTRPASAPPEPVVKGTTDIPGAYAVVTGEGSVWVGAMSLDGSCEGTIHRIDPATGGTTATIPVRGVASWDGSIDVGPDGVWVAGDLCGPDRELGALLQRIDPATDEVDLVVDLGAGSVGEVAATGGSAWVSVFREPERMEVVRVDAATGQIEATTRLGTSYARQLLAAEGAVWAVERREEASPEGSGVLVKIDPVTNEVVASPGQLIHPPEVWNGALWARRRCEIVQIDGATARITGDPLSTRCMNSPVLESILRSGAGGLWFFETGTSEPPPRLVRLNPATGEVDVRVDGSKLLTPIDFAVTDSAIWIVNYEGSLTRVDLRSP